MFRLGLKGEWSLFFFLFFLYFFPSLIDGSGLGDWFPCFMIGDSFFFIGTWTYKIPYALLVSVLCELGLRGYLGPLSLKE